MKNILKRLRNKNFKAKPLYLLFLPLTLLNLDYKRKVKAFALKHWDKNPTIMHRLYWSCTD